jgi:uncharacterized membrane protein YfcA
VLKPEHPQRIAAQNIPHRLLAQKRQVVDHPRSAAACNETFAKRKGRVALSRIAAALAFPHGAAREGTPVDSYILILTAGTLLLAGFIKGAIGSGLPTISIGILSLVMPIPQAVALIVLPSLVTNVWQSLGPRLVTLLKRLWRMFAGICVGAWLGAGLMTGAYSQWAQVGLGVALAIYAALGLIRLHYSLDRKHEPWLAPIVGIATGFIAAGTGIFVIPSGLYLQAIGLKKDDLVQALGITYLVSTVVLAGVVAHAGAMDKSLLVPSVIGLATALIGMVFGQKVRASLPEQTFRTMFFMSLLLLGLHQALRSLL